MFCTKCGNENANDSKFCGGCGVKIETLASPNDEATQKPQSVSTAIKLLWITVAIGLIKLPSAFSPPPNITTSQQANIYMFTVIFTFAIIVFLVSQISGRKNWARITYLVFFIIGLLPTLQQLSSELSNSFFVGVLSLAQFGLQSYALYLLFTAPGKDWFRKAVPA